MQLKKKPSKKPWLLWCEPCFPLTAAENNVTHVCTWITDSPGHDWAASRGLQTWILWRNNNNNQHANTHPDTHTPHPAAQNEVVASCSLCLQVSSNRRWIYLLIVRLHNNHADDWFISKCFEETSRPICCFQCNSFQVITVPAQSDVKMSCSGLLPLSWLLLLQICDSSPTSPQTPHISLSSLALLLSDLYIWMKIYAWEPNVPVLPNQAALLTGSWDSIKV